MNFKIEENELFCLWNFTSKYRDFEVKFEVKPPPQKKKKITQKVKLHSNKGPTFLLLYATTNEKTAKLMQLDRLLPAFKTSPAEMCSDNSGR